MLHEKLPIQELTLEVLHALAAGIPLELPEPPDSLLHGALAMVYEQLSVDLKPISIGSARKGFKSWQVELMQRCSEDIPKDTG